LVYRLFLIYGKFNGYIVSKVSDSELFGKYVEGSRRGVPRETRQGSWYFY
jgi:hypothetical protein